MLSRLTDPAFLREVEEKGAYLRSRLQAMPHVTEVQGLGMMLGAALDAADAKEVASQCVRKGLLVLTAKTRLRFLPPPEHHAGGYGSGTRAVGGRAVSAVRPASNGVLGEPETSAHIHV